MIRILLFAVLLALVACSQPAQTYQPGVQQTFMRACESRSAVQGYCACVWTKIEANVSPADFAALEQLSAQEREANPVMRHINGFRQVCLAEAQREPTPAP